MLAAIDHAILFVVHMLGRSLDPHGSGAGDRRRGGCIAR